MLQLIYLILKSTSFLPSVTGADILALVKAGFVSHIESMSPEPTLHHHQNEHKWQQVACVPGLWLCSNFRGGDQQEELLEDILAGMNLWLNLFV